jgi:hypothetical protein
MCCGQQQHLSVFDSCSKLLICHHRMTRTPNLAYAFSERLIFLPSIPGQKSVTSYAGPKPLPNSCKPHKMTVRHTRLIKHCLTEQHTDRHFMHSSQPVDCTARGGNPTHVRWLQHPVCSQALAGKSCIPIHSSHAYFFPSTESLTSTWHARQHEQVHQLHTLSLPQ